MRRILRALPAILSFILILVALPAQATSFDCAKASTRIENMICNDTELSKLDDDLSKTYKLILEQSKDKQKDINEQRRWLKETRNICADAICLKSAYTARTHALSSSVTNDNSVIPTNSKTACLASTGNGDSAYDVYQGVASNSRTFVQNKKYGIGLTEHATAILDSLSDMKLTTLCDGNIVAVWLQETWGKFPAYLTARIYSDQFQPITREFRITDSSIPEWEQSVASLQNGGFVITWKANPKHSRKFSDIKIFARIFDATGKPLTKTIMVSPTKGQNYHPIAYGLPNGDFAVGWGSAKGGLLRLFDAGGTPKTKEIEVGYWDPADASMYFTTDGRINLFLPKPLIYVDKNYAARNPPLSAISLNLDGSSLTKISNSEEVKNLPGYQVAVERLLRSKALVLEHGLREYRQKDVMGFKFCEDLNFSYKLMGIINADSQDTGLKNFVTNYGKARSECR